MLPRKLVWGMTGEERETETARTLEHNFYPVMTPQFGDGISEYRGNFVDKRALTSLLPAAERQWRAVDVVLDCFLAEEGGRQHGAFASSGNMVKALLVLRQVPVLDDGSLEGFTDFQGGTVAKDDPLVTFEASGESPPPCVPVLGSLHWDSPVPKYTHQHLLPMGPGVLNPVSPPCRPSPQ